MGDKLRLFKSNQLLSQKLQSIWQSSIESNKWHLAVALNANEEFQFEIPDSNKVVLIKSKQVSDNDTWFYVYLLEKHLTTDNTEHLILRHEWISSQDTKTTVFAASLGYILQVLLHSSIINAAPNRWLLKNSHFTKYCSESEIIHRFTKFVDMLNFSHVLEQ